MGIRTPIHMADCLQTQRRFRHLLVAAYVCSIFQHFSTQTLYNAMSCDTAVCVCFSLWRDNAFQVIYRLEHVQHGINMCCLRRFFEQPTKIHFQWESNDCFPLIDSNFCLQSEKWHLFVDLKNLDILYGFVNNPDYYWLKPIFFFFSFFLLSICVFVF